MFNKHKCLEESCKKINTIFFACVPDPLVSMHKIFTLKKYVQYTSFNKQLYQPLELNRTG